MFASMADYFVRQLKISKAFYEMEFKHVNTISRKGMKYNSFGSLLDFYLRCKKNNDMAFFETDSGKRLLLAIERSTTIEEIENDSSHYYMIKLNKKYVDPSKNETNIQKAAIEHEKYSQMVDIHNNNAIISMLIRLESFFQNYFEWLIKKYPDKYLREKSIRYSEVLKYDFDELKHQLAKEAADGIMSQPLNEWLKVIRSHKFDIESLSPFLSEFKEMYYRRNLIVHNNGTTNRAYLESIDNSQGISLGQRLTTDKNYVLNAYSVMMIIVYGVLYASLKSIPEETKDYLDFLFTAGFDHMLEEEWKVGKYVFLLLTSETEQSAVNLTLAKINYWICCKNSGNFDSVRQEIECADFSAMNPSIQMAKEMLLEHFDKGVLLLEDAVAASELTPDVVGIWPIFIQFRKTAYYDQFKLKHAEKLEEQAISTDDLNQPQDKAEIRTQNETKESYKEDILQ